MATAFSLCEEGSVPGDAVEYNNLNRISFANADKGRATDILTVDLWNDRESSEGADEAIAPRVYAANDDNLNPVWAGTAINGFKSMLEARSCLAVGVAADRQSTWTPIGPTQLLVIGNMPAGSKRTIELRLNVPIDAPTIALSNFYIGVSA